MFLTEIAPAAVPAVTLDEFKAHLRLAHGFPDDGSEDGVLSLYLSNATTAIEARSGQALIRRGFRLEVAQWTREGHLLLPIGPVAEIASIELVRGEAVTALPAGAWALQPGSNRQRVTGAAGGALPAIPSGGRAELSFEAGYGADAADVPGDLRQAVMLLGAHFHENRYGEATPGQGVPVAVQALLESHRVLRL